MKQPWNKFSGIQKWIQKRFPTFNLALSGIILVLLCHCSSPKYLPAAAQIDVNPYGSHIRIFQKTSGRLSGELIAVDSDTLYVLTDEPKKCVAVPLAGINRFTLRYARPRHYGWTIPVYSLATLSHGIFSVFTFPLNLITTVVVTISGENAYTYNEKKITYNNLHKFARFPQGFPQGIDSASIE